MEYERIKREKQLLQQLQKKIREKQFMGKKVNIPNINHVEGGQDFTKQVFDKFKPQTKKNTKFEDFQHQSLLNKIPQNRSLPLLQNAEKEKKQKVFYNYNLQLNVYQISPSVG